MTYQFIIADDLREWARARAAALGFKALDAYIRFLIIEDQQQQHALGRKTPVMKYDPGRKCRKCGGPICTRNHSGVCSRCQRKPPAGTRNPLTLHP